MIKGHIDGGMGIEKTGKVENGGGGGRRSAMGEGKRVGEGEGEGKASWDKQIYRVRERARQMEREMNIHAEWKG